MRFLFVNFHPVDPQVVRYVAYELIKKQHKVLFAYVEKENIIGKLINSFGFPSTKIGTYNKSVIGKIVNTLFVGIKLYYQIKKFKPNIIFAPSSPYVGYVSRLCKISYIAWADTETATTNLKHSIKSIDSLLLVDCFYNKIDKKKIIRFKGYKEIAYCHPNWFSPNPLVLQKLNIKYCDKIILMRFSALNAMHDKGLNSYGEKYKSKILNFIHSVESQYIILISASERSLGSEFEKYELKNFFPSDYLSLLSYCTLYIGEGTTTASEAGVLGVPWINIQETKRGYLIEQEKKHGLGIRTSDIDTAIKTAKEWLNNPNLLSEWKNKKERLIKDKINLSAFLTWFIENYPESHSIMKENPDYQDRFK